jgi:hypothetical protein
MSGELIYPTDPYQCVGGPLDGETVKVPRGETSYYYNAILPASEFHAYTVKGNPSRLQYQGRVSLWTHVAGTIRIDRFQNNPSPEQIAEVLGPIVLWDSPQEIWEHPNRTPTGSEGGIHYKFVPGWSLDNGQSWDSIVITGDLRDVGHELFSNKEYWFTNIAAIVEWLNRLPQQLTWLHVRQAIVEIEVEGMPPLIVRFDHERQRFVLDHTRSRNEATELGT